MGEVNCAHCAVAADACHRPLVALEHPKDTGFAAKGDVCCVRTASLRNSPSLVSVGQPAVSGCCVDCALFAPHHVVVHVSCGERHARHSDGFGFVVHQLHGLLHGTHARVESKEPFMLASTCVHEGSMRTDMTSHT